MNRCPLTYEPCSGLYSKTGLHKLSPRLDALQLLPFDAEGLRREAVLRADKMSVQGVQAKLSARLEPSKEQFTIVDANGRFILKPQNDWPELPQNEDFTMRLAAVSGIEVPLHGLMYAQDRSLTYFIKRFDRVGIVEKLPLGDFTPAYDFLNSSIVLRDPVEVALPLNGKKKNLTRNILLHYWGRERLGLTPSAVDDVLQKFARAFNDWGLWINKSFLSQPLRESYMELVATRRKVLGL